MECSDEFMDEMEINFNLAKRKIPITSKTLGNLRDFSTFLAFLMNFIYLVWVDRKPNLKKIDFPLWAEVLSFVLGGF